MKNEEIHKLDMKSKDIVEDNISKISKLFPDSVSEGKIDFDMLKQELSKDIIEDGKERYQLTWVGKKEAIVNANTPCNKTLRPLRKKSVDFDNTKNIYIEGDNLEVLKILQESYLNKIKCIYIDPPYNTGNDFIYNDKFVNENELIESGQTDEYNNRLISNQESNGKYHSDWLSMMYARLKLARNLLKKDGVIFISIGENEIDNLKKITTEIFGENNYITTIVRKTKTTSNNGNQFAASHEYIVVAAKNIDTLNIFNDSEAQESEEYLKLFKNEDENGKYNIIGLYQPALKHGGSTYPIQCPDGSFAITPEGKPWRWNQETFNKNNAENRVVFKETKTSPLLDLKGNKSKWNIYTKLYLHERLDAGMRPITFIDKYTNSEASKELLKMGIPFDFSKPRKLIQYLIKICENDKNSIIMDFFSGSATTAHAVMQLNSEDNGNRKYILVQLPENTNMNFKAKEQKYDTICDIGEERIRRAGKKIKEETNANIDYGFRVYKVDSSNMKDIYYVPTDLKQSQLNMFESNIKEDRTTEDLLTQVILDLGLTLDLSIEEKKILNNKVYFVEKNSLVACFDDEIDINIVDEICKCNPLKIVFKESSFKTDSDKINIFERIKKLSSESEVNII